MILPFGLDTTYARSKEQEAGKGAGVGAGARGWREPRNMTLQRSRIFGLVLFKKRITDQGVRPAWQRQSGERAG